MYTQRNIYCMYICIYGVMGSGKILIIFFNAVRTINKIELTSVVLAENLRKLFFFSVG